MSANPLTDAKPYAIVGAPLHVRRWDDVSEAIIDGWEIKARWLANDAIIRVFVPDTTDIPTRADQLIRYQGDQLDRLQGAP